MSTVPGGGKRPACSHRGEGGEGFWLGGEVPTWGWCLVVGCWCFPLVQGTGRSQRPHGWLGFTEGLSFLLVGLVKNRHALRELLASFVWSFQRMSFSWHASFRPFYQKQGLEWKNWKGRSKRLETWLPLSISTSKSLRSPNCSTTHPVKIFPQPGAQKHFLFEQNMGSFILSLKRIGFSREGNTFWKPLSTYLKTSSYSTGPVETPWTMISTQPNISKNYRRSLLALFLSGRNKKLGILVFV